MAEALSDKTIEIVKSTVPALEAGGTAITDRMYQLMFREASIYSRLAAAPGGWSGWRDFVVESTKPESEVIRSLPGNGAQGRAAGRRVLPQTEGRQPGGVAERRRGAHADDQHSRTRGAHGQRAAALVHPRPENGRVHAMGAHVRELAARTRNVTVRTFYNVPDPGDQAGRDYDERGLISGSWLARTLCQIARSTES